MQLAGRSIYINLERRKDRRAEFEAECIKMDLSGVERFPAIQRHPGIIGCGLSHLAALRLAQERQWPYVCIFEDDFEFLVSRVDLDAQLNRLFQSGQPWDVVMLGYHINASRPHSDHLVKVLDAQTASGYLVHQSYYATLIDLYEKAMPLLETTGRHWEYANDQVWKQLQSNANWFAFHPRIGRQRASFSDTAEQFMDYGI